MVKSLPAVRETWVRSLDQEAPLEKEMATHSSILVCKIPWMQEPSQLQSMGSQRVGHDWATSLSLSPFQFKTKLKHYPPTSTRAGPWVRQVGGGGVGTIYPNFLSTIHQVFQNKFLFEPQQAKKKKSHHMSAFLWSSTYIQGVSALLVHILPPRTPEQHILLF